MLLMHVMSTGLQKEKKTTTLPLLPPLLLLIPMDATRAKDQEIVHSFCWIL